MEKKIRRICSTIGTVLVAIVVVFAALLVGSRLFGVKPYTVLSGSMEPEYHVGSLIYVSPVDPKDLTVDTPITYQIPGQPVTTHRIIEVLNESGSLSFRTKGDANDDPDSGSVPASAVLGKPIFEIPLLGYLAYFIGLPIGRIVSIAVCILIIFTIIIPDMIYSKKALKSESEKSSEDAPLDFSEGDRELIKEEIKRVNEELKLLKENAASSTPMAEEGSDALSDDGKA